jgi:two-component system, chemotaxis family, protein-glutamate methylesterase/glutaminase
MEAPRHNQFDIVAIGASAGGVEATAELLGLLPHDLDATILVVIHRPVTGFSHLADILSHRSHWRVVVAKDRQTLEHGCCYISPLNEHLIIGQHNKLHLLSDGFYRGHTIDALFGSLARHAGSRTIGVVLSGMLKDGSLGLRSIKEAGGLAFVQSPETAPFSQMPRNAIAHDGPVDLIGSIPAIAAEIRARLGAADDF